MTNIITEARELCEKATPGPWIRSKFGLNILTHDSEISTATQKYTGPSAYVADQMAALDANAAFIARSRTLIPELCDALEKAGAQMPRWIPVSERLPENGRYLTCSVWYGKQMININSFSTDRSKVDDYDMRGLGAGFYNYHSESGYFPVDNITHWMPLPAPQEEGAEHERD